MDSVIRLVRSYRFASGLSERLNLADSLIREISPQLRLFILGKVDAQSADDVAQETLAALVAGLGAFQGDTNAQFWGWVYQVARNRASDHHRRKGRTPSDAWPEHDIRALIDASESSRAMSGADRADLKYALDLLAASKPECSDDLWSVYVLGLTYEQIASEKHQSYDQVRMRVSRCLETAKALVR